MVTGTKRRPRVDGISNKAVTLGLVTLRRVTKFPFLFYDRRRKNSNLLRLVDYAGDVCLTGIDHLEYRDRAQSFNINNTTLHVCFLYVCYLAAF